MLNSPSHARHRLGANIARDGITGGRSHGAAPAEFSTSPTSEAVRSIRSRVANGVVISIAIWLTVVQANSLSTLRAQRTDPSADGSVPTLIALLKSDASVYDKAMACRHLGATGDARAIDALTSLLADRRLAAYARTALESMPSPAVDTALRNAVGELDAEFLVGVLRVIAKRRDVDALDAVAAHLSDTDDRVFDAAAQTIGEIGDQRSARILESTLAKTNQQRRVATARAILKCAQRLMYAGDIKYALRLYGAVRDAKVAEELTQAATLGVILASGAEDLTVLGAELRSDDKSRFRVALLAAHELGPATMELLKSRYRMLPPSRQCPLLVAIGEIDGSQAVSLFSSAAKNADKDVQIVALGALGRHGDGTVIPVLLDSALGKDDDVASAAIDALTELSSGRLDQLIVDWLRNDNWKTVEVAVKLAGARNIGAATPRLFDVIDHGDERLRNQATLSLGATVRSADLTRLTALVVDSTSQDFTTAAREALRIACARLPQDACARQLAGAMANASSSTRVVLLEQIAQVGGTKALETVVAAARSSDDSMQDAATRLLGEWLTADAAPELYDLASSLENNRYRIRTLRGYIRIARQLDMTAEERLEVCQNALSIAERMDEKKLALQALGRISTPDAAELAIASMHQAPLRQSASRAAVSIAERLVQSNPEKAIRTLEQVVTAVPESRTGRRARTLLENLTSAASDQ